LEVVLRPSQVQGEGVIEQPEPGEGFLQAVDGPSSGVEDLVQIVGGGVVGSAFSDRSPLLPFPAPVKKIRTGRPSARRSIVT
jgi:hypothetical protein